MSCPGLSNKNAVELIFEFSSVRLQSAGTRTSLTAPSLPPTEGIPAGPGAALLCADMPGGVGGWALEPLPSVQTCGISMLGQPCATEVGTPAHQMCSDTHPPVYCAVKQRNSICGSDLRGAIFSKKVGQGLQRCCLRNEQPPLSPGGLFTSSHAAGVEVQKADLTTSHDCSHNRHCRATWGKHTYIKDTEVLVWVCLGPGPSLSQEIRIPSWNISNMIGGSCIVLPLRFWVWYYLI